MSYNLVDPTTGDLTRVAGSIDTSIIPSDASASNKLVTQNNIGSQTVASANKIVPNYTSKTLAEVTSTTTKYIKVADCSVNQPGTLQVYLKGNSFKDTVVINFDGGHSIDVNLCGHYSGNSHGVKSVIAQKGSIWDSGYSIYLKITQYTTCQVLVTLLKGDCTIDISESTTAPTNISEWPVNYGLFGNITSPDLTSLEKRVAALESKL